MVRRWVIGRREIGEVGHVTVAEGSKAVTISICGELTLDAEELDFLIGELVQLRDRFAPRRETANQLTRPDASGKKKRP